MAESSIPVDLLNPGQVFACLGFLEAAEILLSNAQGGFDWSDESDIQFRLKVEGGDDPFVNVLSFLAHAEIHSIATADAQLETEKWSVPTKKLSADTPFPYPMPDSPATLPAVLACPNSEHQIQVDHWADGRKITSRDNVKFWAGAGGYPGVALARDGLNLIRDRIATAAIDPFNLFAEQSSSFRLDWRRDYIPLDIGFSINSHSPNRFSTIGYPLVEILGSIGLTHARPQYLSKLQYRYGVLGVGSDSELFSPFFLRASLGAPELPFPQRSFRMNLGWPGKEGQARCITTVYEEFSND